MTQNDVLTMLELGTLFENKFVFNIDIEILFLLN